MRRRKYLAAVGSLAAGGAAMMGTGAVSSFEATRDVEVDLSTDATAQVGLVAGSVSDGSGEYVTTGSTNNKPAGTLGVELDQNSAGNGNGVNAQAVTTFEDLFRILNQTPENKRAYITYTKNSGGAYRVASGVDPSDITIRFLNAGGSSIVGKSNSKGIVSGSSLHVTMEIDTTAVPNDANINNAGHLLEDITVNVYDPDEGQ